MENAKSKLIKNYIFLLLIVILFVILLIPLGWIANHVPNGIIGLIIVIGYLIIIGALTLFLLSRVGNALIIAEYEFKNNKSKTK